MSSASGRRPSPAGATARLVGIVLLAVGVTLLGVAPAVASSGVSIDVGSIDISDDLAPGGQYRLPAFGVRNPGTDETAYEIVVSYVDGQAAMRPAQAWFRFEPATLVLEGGDFRAVNTSLEIPADAEPGTYTALVGPTIVGRDGGAQVGAGAAARLTFTVEPASPLDAWLRWLWRFLGDNPWIWIGALVLVALGAFAILRGRFQFSVSRRA